MSGKFQICLIILINLFFFNYIFTETNNIKFVIINGYILSNYSKEDLKGIRYKALADYYLRKGNLAKSIKFYEDALYYITNEADIYFQLANIYYKEKIYLLAIKYYKLAENYYLSPENINKSRKYYYLSLIRKGICLMILKDFEDNINEARRIASKIIIDEDELKRDYPDITEELDLFFNIVYGSAGKPR